MVTLRRCEQQLLPTRQAPLILVVNLAAVVVAFKL
tara:strand:+ start:491 stop:595 length:105 start_codon:yes stop_codon:yes gene_type:complete